MIVKYTKNGWELVTQRSHGLLAAQVAFHWRVKDRPARWVETLLAIAEHDDAELELDGETLITTAGGPLDYSMKNFDKSRCERLAALTFVKSRYIGLLISMHMEFLYRDEAKTNNDARDYLKKQKRIRTVMLRELRIKEKEIKSTYRLLEWCDAFSLLICQGKIPPEGRETEISTGPDGKPYNMFQVTEKVLCVDPWPFEVKTFEVCFESRSVHHLAFQDSGEIRTALINAPIDEIRWTICKKARRYKKRPKT